MFRTRAGPPELMHISTMLLAFESEPMLAIVNTTLREGGSDCYWIERQISRRALALGAGANLAVAASFADNLNFAHAESVRDRCSDELHTSLWGATNLSGANFPSYFLLTFCLLSYCSSLQVPTSRTGARRISAWHITRSSSSL